MVQDEYRQHLLTKGHLNRTRGETGALVFCTICQKYVPGIKNWQGHITGAKHASNASSQGLPVDVAPEEPEQVPGHQLCVVCNRHIPSRFWANHPNQAQHREREQFLKFASAVEETEKDRNGLSIIGDFDFKIAEPNLAASGILRNGTIQTQVPASRTTLMDIRLASSQGQKTFSPFTVTLNAPSRIISSRSSLTFTVKMTQAHLGRAEDRIEFFFEDIKLKSRFIITRPLRVIVGSQVDHEMLKPKTPYVPRKRTERQPETEIVEGEAPPSTKAIPYVDKLTFANIPRNLETTLATGSTKEIIDRVRRLFLPSVLTSQTYAKHFKHLVWAEEFQMDRDLEYYDINNASLSRFNSYYYLVVPGLAEKRPSVLVGDRILVRKPNSPPGHWFEGGVHVVRKEEVGLRFHRSFSASPSDRFLVRFKLNRFPVRRQHQALDTAFSQDRVMFPTNLHLPRRIPATIASPSMRWRNPLIAGNPPQKQAVLSILHREPGSMPFVIFGPPGTGKTVTMVEAILQVLALNPTSRILATAPSNSAADLITSRLATGGLKTTELFRGYAPSRSKTEIPTSVEPHTFKNRDGIFSVPGPGLTTMLRFRVIVTTCVSASMLSGIGMPRGHFSHIFVDEAGQATEPEAMIGIKSIADNNTNLVLSGDPKQLGPIIRSSVARMLGLETSFIERLMKREIYDEVKGYGKSVVKLTKNFRSHGAILKFPNERFYGGDLECCGDPKVINFYLDSQHIVAKKFPIVFHSIAGKDDREASSPSFFNIDEATQVKELVQKLRGDRRLRITDNDIGVIAPYHAQVLKIRTALRAVADLIKVGSVESFKGSREFVQYDLRHTLGFVANPRRFNVAVTRAQSLLYIVGDPSVLSIDPLWRAFLNYIHRNGGWKGPGPTWDTRVDVDENGKYDVGVREKARDDMNEFTRMMEALTLDGVRALEDDDDGEMEVDMDCLTMSLMEQVARLRLNDGKESTNQDTIVVQFRDPSCSTDTLARPTLSIADNWVTAHFDATTSTPENIDAFTSKWRPSCTTITDHNVEWIAVNRGMSFSPHPPLIEEMKSRFDALAQEHRKDGNITLTASALDRLALDHNITSAKWLVFTDVSNVDYAWNTIVRLVCLERKRGFTKVSVNKGDERHVICVYVDDFGDEDEVWELREDLRKVGVEQGIGFKLDAYSHLGIYISYNLLWPSRDFSGIWPCLDVKAPATRISLYFDFSSSFCMEGATFKDIPELFEVDLGESLTARTEALSTFRELGPPDLCHVVKSTGRSGQRDLGSYHYISGVDASSSASLAAYINSLTYAIEDNSAWFSKSSSWKVKNGCFCCFNAFSRVDVRVDVKIPGGVNAYVIDLRGERHDASPEIWQETYVSALLRSILYSDDSNYWLDGYRKLDPITNPESEIRFLQAAEALFTKGWQVGSDPEIQVATVVSNHLTAGIMKYFGDSGRYQPIANLFEKLTAKEPEVASLLARSYIGMNEEVKAVQIMSSSIRQTPHSYTLLHAQCDLLRSKGKYDWAVKLARQAVNCAPSEFVTWEKLTECWIDLGEFESALLTLNSCPMFTFNGRDMHRNLTPAKLHLPFNRPIGEILPERVKTEDDEADPALLRLPAPGLRGTWARAYALLTRLVSQIGWDELLKTRSYVFVMEEEYRMQKAQGDIAAVAVSSTSEDANRRAVIHEDGSVRDSIAGTTLGGDGDDEGEGDEDDNASTRGMVSPHGSRKSGSLSMSNGAVAGSGVSDAKVGLGLDTPGSAGSSGSAPGIPTIRISTESDRHLDEDGNDVPGDVAVAGSGTGVNGKRRTSFDESRDVYLEKPAPAQAPSEDDGEKEKDGAPPSPQTQNADADGDATQQQQQFSFSNKRLCERWLDNLFMVLYEDLRVWTIFRAEVAHFKTQHVAYRKTGLEWEILGDLGTRLHHKEEAKEAYQRCLDTPRYSQKPWAKLMDVYAEEGDIQRGIQTAIRVASYQWADYTEMTYPTQIARAFFKLGQIHGHAKISMGRRLKLRDMISEVSDGCGRSYSKFYTHYDPTGFLIAMNIVRYWTIAWDFITLMRFVVTPTRVWGAIINTFIGKYIKSSER
ncbi:hypothetical protein D9757_006011 [Collybiopsis confluens]|uniref:RNA helicase n=1 Tax=Collybiopsis confluens TaxID=2823264 RepID=A0A8H5HUJ9_9AGAR|nr:hypothetical protein D9757_006011 [Collybiopsis confluens]